jgi:2-succinyl-5-enolpyruvyl-6-hydroxy-3-cyclohexene-1-carboxylate synthase
MIHHLQHIVDLVEICRLKGIQHVVVSPGSRNAPLIRLFFEQPQFILHSIVDERSAGFFALGISQATHSAVIMVCTSGTAVLNYSPALAEAYYQHVPLIAITADRPEELIDQQDNQTIRQINVFQNYTKACLHLERPEKEGFDGPEQHGAIASVINRSLTGIKGPIHINVPISEPLYVPMPEPSAITFSPFSELERIDCIDLEEAWINSCRRVIVCGEDPVDERRNWIVNRIADSGQAVVFAEPIANIRGDNMVCAVDRALMFADDETLNSLNPDLLISFGGPVVSKRLKQWLQKQKGTVHFRISADDEQIDTYQNLTAHVKGDPTLLLARLNDLSAASNSCFVDKWKSISLASGERLDRLFENVPYSDLWVYNHLISMLPQGNVLHLGNSSPVRYAQLFDIKRSRSVHSNRGVSGIDGCLSTAVGFASASDELNFVLLGDLSFVYDSNALWNRNLPKNLRIIVINNQGGGIFRLLPGPPQQPGFEEYMEANHPVSIEKLASAFGVDYFRSENKDELNELFDRFVCRPNHAALLEIVTPRLEHAGVYANFVKNMKSDRV